MVAWHDLVVVGRCNAKSGVRAAATGAQEELFAGLNCQPGFVCTRTELSQDLRTLLGSGLFQNVDGRVTPSKKACARPRTGPPQAPSRTRTRCTRALRCDAHHTAARRTARRSGRRARCCRCRHA